MDAAGAERLCKVAYQLVAAFPYQRSLIATYRIFCTLRAVFLSETQRQADVARRPYFVNGEKTAPQT